MITGGSSRGPMSSTQARSSSPDKPAVAVEHGGGELAGVDRHVGAVIGAGQGLQLGGDPVDEGVDVLGEDPWPRPASYVPGPRSSVHFARAS